MMNDTQTTPANQMELFLLQLRYREGQLIEAEGNQPIMLDNPDLAYVVYSGAIDLFAVSEVNGEVQGARQHLFRSAAGQLILGVSADQASGGLRLLARGTAGTRLLRLSQARLWAMARELEYADLIGDMIEPWFKGLVDCISSDLAPKDSTALESGQSYSCTAGETVFTSRGLVWAELNEGTLHLYADPDLALPHGRLFPLGHGAWATAPEATIISTVDTLTALQSQAVIAGVGSFHELVLDALSRATQRDGIDDRDRWAARLEIEQAQMGIALAQLSATITPGIATPSAPSADALLSACRLIGERLNINFPDLPRDTKTQSMGEHLKLIERVARVRMRSVALRGQWWRQDSGPLLAFDTNDQRPLALLPARGGYVIHDPQQIGHRPVTSEIAANILPLVYSIYRPLPPGKLSAWKLIRFSLLGSERDLGLVLLVGVFAGLLGLLPPIALGWMINQIVPEGRVDSLLTVGLSLLLVALAVGALQVARGLTLLRVQSRLDSSLQAAIWDRLLTLPIPFFRNYTSGALGSRAMGVSEVRYMLAGHFVSTILNSVFSVFSLALLFYYSPPLAAVTLGLVVVAFAVTIGIANVYVRNLRQLQEIQADVSGAVLQLLQGIIKIRVAGAEGYAFAQWAGRFAQQKRLAYRGRRITNMLSVYNSVYPLLVLMLIFGLVSFAPAFQLPAGDFLSFNLAFSQFLGAWLLLGSSLVYILPVIPVLERLRPILEATPETDEIKARPGVLSGKIEVNRVRFRYAPQSQLILDEVSLEARPGEFIALVGGSGSGKSTLLRLLLGFYKAESGGIYIDDLDLSDLDLSEVRPQIGVVLQNASLMAGDIYSNIIGSSPTLTVEDAWNAARMVGIDEEIKAMPMGMHTVISEGGSNFSGGQRQRLLIARAIVNRPRILLFDEATSALDNRAQEVVSRSLEGLQATRIVIAHRLSTVVKADRIYVFEKGRIVQVGTYQNLINAPGPFAELARRQLA